MNLVAIYGSPRREGNTDLLLRQAVLGAREAGADVEEIKLRRLKMAPCLEIYGCRKDGRCVIKDDFRGVYDSLVACDGILLASPIFFSALSAQTKILIDRCQSLWVKKYWIEKAEPGRTDTGRKALFISVGASSGKRLFDGSLMTVRAFLDVLDMELWRSLLHRGLDFKGDVLKHPEYLEEAEEAGRGLFQAIREARAVL